MLFVVSIQLVARRWVANTITQAYYATSVVGVVASTEQAVNLVKNTIQSLVGQS